MGTNLLSKEQIKIILAREGITAKTLAEMLTQQTGKRYSQQMILSRIHLSSFNYDEVATIADILGYEIHIVKK